MPIVEDSQRAAFLLAIVQVLERLGHTIEYPEGQTCCGQPPFNSGYWEEARTIAALAAEGPLVVVVDDLASAKRLVRDAADRRPAELSSLRCLEQPRFRPSPTARPSLWR